MNKFIALLLLLVCSTAQAGITFTYTAGETLYVRFGNDATGVANTAVPLTAGSGLNTGVYTVSDAVIAAATPDLIANTEGWMFTVHSGNYLSQSANDPELGSGILRWSGTVEVSLATQADVEAFATSDLDADIVVPARTFFVGSEGNKADNIITLDAWEDDELRITLSANFEGENGLNPGTSIQTFESVTITSSDGETEITTENLRRRQDLMAVNFDIAEPITEPDRYTVRIKVGTSDSQLLSLRGILVIESVE